jgi:RNA polymerase sigma factor (sigma-70 family)
MEQPVSMTLKVEQNRQIAEIIANERQRLRNFIRTSLPIEADVEDLLQEVFLRAIEAYRLPEPVEQWGAWMFRVARNRIVDYFRRKRVRGVEAKPTVDEEGTERRPEDNLPSRDSGPAEAYAQSVLRVELEEALDELPGEQREVFVAHELEGLSFKEISARTGVGVNTLISRKHYAVLHLRRRLKEIHDEFRKTGEN